MTEPETRVSRVRTKIDASLDRLQRGEPLPPVLRVPAEAEPPESLSGLAGQYPVAAVAGGLALGVLVGALLPKRMGGKLASRAFAAATLAARIGLAYSDKARNSAEGAGREGLQAVRRGASVVSGRAQGTGLSIAREVVRLAARARR